MERRRRSRVACGLALAFAMGSAHGTPAERYESPEVPSSDVLKADVDKAATLSARLSGQPRQPCPDFAPLRGHQCVLNGGTGYVTGSTLPWVLGAAVASWNHDSLQWLLSSEPITEGTVWARDDKVENSHQHAREIRPLVGHSFGCVGVTCLTVTEVFSPKAPDVRAWAICEQGAHHATVPRFCVPVLAQTQGVTWLRAWAYFAAEGGEGRPDFKAYLLLPSTEAPPAVPLAISRGLGAAPWSMDVDASPTVILASAGRRTSSVNRAMREEPTVRVDISQDLAFSTQLNAKVRYVKVMVSTTLYVNELNTTQNEDWHLPSPEFQKQYVMALHLFVQRTLGEVCPSIQWLDGQRGVCGFPQSSYPALLEVSLP